LLAQVANEVDGAPEAWLGWAGKWKLLLGKTKHANWHFTDATRKRPSDLAMFIIRNEDPSWVEVLIFLAEWLPLQLLMRVKQLLRMLGCMKQAPEEEEEQEEERETEEEKSSEGSAGAEARMDRLRKRLYASAGFIGVYVTWVSE
jgi:hypothetical protein